MSDDDSAGLAGVPRPMEPGADRLPAVDDFGQPCQIFSETVDTSTESGLRRDGVSWVVADREGGQYQVNLVAVRETGEVGELWIQRTTRDGKSTTVLNLAGGDARRLIGLLGNKAFMSVSSDREAKTVAPRIDSAPSGEALQAIYQQAPERFRSIIVDDASARDVVAVAHRRAQIAEFRRLLSDSDYFDSMASAKGPEAVWQTFIEANPWILGVSLAGQLTIGWSDARLEQVVTGASVGGPGKRSDALLRTVGRIRSMVFLELKHHRTTLLHKEYRPGCWSVSNEVAGGVAQVQGTVQYAMSQLGSRLQDRDELDNDIPGSFTYLVRPRSYLVVGSLDQLRAEGGGDNQPKVQSFELFRRHLDEPEIITFDELLARAEWLVDIAESTG